VKVLLLGAGGQVGKCLLETAPRGYSIDARTHDQLDIADRQQIANSIAETQPDVVINAAAFTAVDRAETQSAIAYAVNDQGVAALAECCRSNDVRLVHISTDYVFDGDASVAREPDAPTNPINVYGASKLAGERRIADAGVDAAIVRSSWIYSAHGQNFLLTMLRLMRERGQVSVVNDQIGAPTSASNLAEFLWRVVSISAVSGTLHYSDNGVASWYDFAVAINEEAMAASVLERPAVVKPISTAEYPTPAKRPRFSLLSTRSTLERVPFPVPHWREALRHVLQRMRSNRQ
jgi:dTDP-4-dehydrorhamnose reductase